MYDYNNTIHCFDNRPCFARGKESYNCKILRSTYPPDKCPFCKQERSITGGKTYDFVDMNFMYGKKRRFV